ncbi:MAG: hypothetical protein M0R77_21265 [Gammaproteobacteria bacterium]|jgi:hypothetical protein|nr:hypothetical protein [Acholeplasmataceae bacterium]MCK9533010.1 hypothetical protein [Gammaproteobacteria bacterium]MDY0101070.1 hypothetical protein [Bacilli bacterium]
MAKAGGFWIKWLNENKYSSCSFNKDGNLYFVERLKVQRGMGNQLADEILIVGMNKKQVLAFLKRNNAVIVYRDIAPEESQIKITK